MKPRLVPSSAAVFGFIPPGLFSICICALLLVGAVTGAHAQSTNPPVNLQFHLYFQRDGANFVTKQYTLQGPVDGGPLFAGLPLTRAGDFSGLLFATERQEVYKLDASAGTFESIPLSQISPQMAQQGWPTGLGFDSHRNEILLTSLGGEGYLHTYSPSNGWRLLTSMNNWDVDTIEHHGHDDTLYVVRNSYVSSTGETFPTAPLVISRIGRDGTHGSSINVGNLPFGVGFSDHQSDLVSIGEYLVLLLEPGSDFHDKGQPKESRIYLIRPAMGQVWLTYRAPWSPTPPNEPPSVSITTPSNGALLQAGTTVKLNAIATDVDGFVQSLEFFSNGQSLGFGQPTINAAGMTFFELDWIATTGTHVITARATDHQGASRISSGVSVSVSPVDAEFTLKFYPVGGLSVTGGQVFSRRYLPTGPVEPGRLIPGMHVVPDGQGNHYGTHWHNVYKIDSANVAQEMTLPAGIEEFSWTMGVTFDTRRNRLLVVSLGGDGFLYGYSVASNSWSIVANMNNHDYDSLAYDHDRDLIYAIENGAIQKLNSSGQIVGTINFAIPNIHLGPGGYHSEMVVLGSKLAVLVEPVVYNQIGAGQESRIYLIDLATGQSQLTYRKVWPTTPANQPPTVQILQPVEGTHFTLGATIGLRASASDLDGQVLGVEFFANGNQIGTATQNPQTGVYELQWTPANSGPYMITANAVDDMGGIGNAPGVGITVHTPQPTPPVVSVRTIDPEATEVPTNNIPDTAQFEISRDGDLLTSFTVYFSMHGTATEGADYRSPSNHVAFPVGVNSVRVTIVPVGDRSAILERMETVAIRIEPSPAGSYLVNANEREAAAVIYERSFPLVPELEIAIPSNGDRYQPGEPIRILAVAAGVPAITLVHFNANGQRIGSSVYNPPPVGGQGFAIEAEDFDYDGGEHISVADQMPYAGGAYDGLSAVHNIDYFRRNDVFEGNIYRVGESPNVPMFSSPEAVNLDRGTWEVTTNYRIGWMDDGTWMNYTRNFPPGLYRVFAALAHGDANSTMRASLAKVLSGQGTMFQNLEELGEFVGPSTGNWTVTSRVPLTSNGDEVHVALNGEQTLRFQGRSGDFDYLLLEPVGIAAPPHLIWHEFVWTNAPAGEHIITAETVLPNGQPLFSSPIHIVVGPDQSASFVRRELPDNYVAGTPFVVSLVATPPAGTDAYGVEDVPPAGWLVSNISHEGVFDTATGKVKFGPYTDAQSRTLTYTVTPPQSATGAAEFNGSSSRDGVLYAISGDRTIQGGSEFHPADTDQNKVITLVELTAYAAAWKAGDSWPTGPSPIPVSYVTRAALIWKHGEAYRFEPSLPGPFCWVPANDPLPPVRVGIAMAPWVGSERIAAASIAPGATTQVALKVEPAAGSASYAIEEKVPAGWTVSQISEGGVFDPITRTIRWGVFLDANSRTLTYSVTAPSGVASVANLKGVVSIDGSTATVMGANRVVASNGATTVALTANRSSTGQLQFSVSAAAGQSGVIEYSTDLVNWAELQPVTASTGTVTFTDSGASGPARFYRFRID